MYTVIIAGALRRKSERALTAYMGGWKASLRSSLALALSCKTSSGNNKKQTVKCFSPRNSRVPMTLGKEASRRNPHRHSFEPYSLNPMNGHASSYHERPLFDDVGAADTGITVAVENDTALTANQLQRRRKQLLLVAVACDASMLLNHLSGIQVFVVPPVRSIIWRRRRFVLRSSTVHEV